MRTRSLVVPGALLAALAGCATTPTEVGRIAKQYDEHVYAVWTTEKGITMVMRDCPVYPVIEGNAVTGYQSPPCQAVAGTRDPADLEFWKFRLYHVEQIRVGPYGIPLIPVSPKFKSNQTTKVGVAGPRETCEAARLTMDRKPPGVAGDETTHMTEPCEGPFYFRRMPETTAGRD